MKSRRKKLAESIQWHQFDFDADSEVMWIKERVHLVSSEDYGKNLTEAQALNIKHKVRFFIAYFLLIFSSCILTDLVIIYSCLRVERFKL